MYAAGITATLTRYPLGLVEECCDFGSEYVRSREFPPTIASIGEWCDRRLRFHEAFAAWKPQPARPPVQQFSDQHCAEMRQRIAGIPKQYFRSMSEAAE